MNMLYIGCFSQIDHAKQRKQALSVTYAVWKQSLKADATECNCNMSHELRWIIKSGVGLN